MVFLKRIWNFINSYFLPYLLRYTLLLAISVIPVYLMFTQKPQSLIILFCGLLMLIIFRILCIKIRLLNKIRSKIIIYLKPIAIFNNKLTYIECLFLSCFACDLAFEKTFAIISCVIAIFVFIFLDIINHLPLNINKIGRFTSVFTAILMAFIFVAIVFKYTLPITVTLFAVLIMTIFEQFSHKIKRFDQPLLFTVFNAILLSLLSLSVVV